MIRIAYRGLAVDNRLARLVGTDGLDSSCMDVQTEAYASMDGAQVTGARLGRRDVRLRYAIVGDPEEARAHIYEIFRLRRPATLVVATRDKRVSLSGTYVSGIDCDIWSATQTMEVSIACPDPWFYSTTAKVFDPVSTEQWTVKNEGEEVGFVAQVKNSGYVRIAGELQRIAWDASADVPASTVLTLDTREGHRDLYYMDGTTKVSCLGYITEWYWPQMPHNMIEGYVRSTAVNGTLTLTERWGAI